MREIFTSGSVGRAPGNRCLYLEPDLYSAGALRQSQDFRSMKKRGPSCRTCEMIWRRLLNRLSNFQKWREGQALQSATRMADKKNAGQANTFHKLTGMELSR